MSPQISRSARGKRSRATYCCAVVEDPDVEVELGGQMGDRLADVPAADDQQPAARQNRQIGDAALGVGAGPIRQRLQVFEDDRRRMRTGPFADTGAG